MWFTFIYLYSFSPLLYFPVHFFFLYYFTFRYSFTLRHFMFLLLYLCFSFIYVCCSFSLLSFCFSFTCVFLFLHFRFSVSLLVFPFPFPVHPWFRTPYIVIFLDQNSFQNSDLECVVLIHILYTMLAEHWSRTTLLPRDIRLGCHPDLSSKVGEKDQPEASPKSLQCTPNPFPWAI